MIEGTTKHIALVLVVWLSAIGALSGCDQSHRESVGSPVVDPTADALPDITLTDAHGHQVSLASLRGGPVLLDFIYKLDIGRHLRPDPTGSTDEAIFENVIRTRIFISYRQKDTIAIAGRLFLIGSGLTSARTTSSWTSTETTNSYKETDREEGNYPRRTV